MSFPKVTAASPPQYILENLPVELIPNIFSHLPIESHSSSVDLKALVKDFRHHVHHALSEHVTTKKVASYMESWNYFRSLQQTFGPAYSDISLRRRNEAAVSLLLQMSQMTHLNLNGASSTTARFLIESLSPQVKLQIKQLDLHGIQKIGNELPLSDEDLTWIAKELPNVEAICIGGGAVIWQGEAFAGYSITLQGISAFAQSGNLKSLHLWDINLAPGEVLQIATAYPTLVEFMMYDNRQSPQVMMWEALIELPPEHTNTIEALPHIRRFGNITGDFFGFRTA